MWGRRGIPGIPKQPASLDDVQGRVVHVYTLSICLSEHAARPKMSFSLSYCKYAAQLVLAGLGPGGFVGGSD